MRLSNKIKNRINAYFKGFESKADFTELQQWFNANENEALPDASQAELSRIKVKDRLLVTIAKDQQPIKPLYQPYFMKIAASILLVASAMGGYFYYSNHYVYQELDAAAIAAIQPIQDSVKLTFEDGKIIYLSADTASNEEIKRVQQIIDGQLVYKDNTEKIVTNTINTPKGNIFRISLPDGTKVWMNAHTELSFPSQFTTAERRVELKGEAYFEVAKKEDQPFVVAFEDQQVKVLGTHFNITAYSKAIQYTTLVEGKVQVERANEITVLSPNEQLVATNGKTVKRAVDAAEYITWRDNFFAFHNATPNDIMEQLARWYDLQIKPDNSSSKERFSGKIDRNMNLDKVLEVLRAADIHFKISENNLKTREIELRK